MNIEESKIADELMADDVTVACFIMRFVNDERMKTPMTVLTFCKLI